MKNNQVKDLIIAALGIALVFLATFLIKIPNGIQGYIHLGDGFILLFASIVNPFFAFLIGGVGSGIADIVGGYGIYFIPTLLIKGFEGVVVSILIHKLKEHKPTLQIMVYILGGCIMIAGYFLADAIINESVGLALTGILANVIQASAGVVIAMLTYPIIRRMWT